VVGALLAAPGKALYRHGLTQGGTEEYSPDSPLILSYAKEVGNGRGNQSRHQTSFDLHILFKPGKEEVLSGASMNRKVENS
jgi:hypothetical protein